jgi:hypothetical protein
MSGPRRWAQRDSIFNYHLELIEFFPFDVECKNQEKLNVWEASTGR